MSSHELILGIFLAGGREWEVKVPLGSTKTSSGSSLMTSSASSNAYSELVVVDDREMAFLVKSRVVELEFEASFPARNKQD